MTPDTLRLLKEAREGNSEARNLIIMKYYGLVVAVAKRQYTFIEYRDDYIQNGILGIIRAIETYDPDKAAFTTYAAYWIKRKIQDVVKTREVTTLDEEVPMFDGNDCDFISKKDLLTVTDHDPDNLLWDVIQRLPIKQQAVIKLIYYEDVTPVEIAKLSGFSPQYIREVHNKALLKLRGMIRDV